MSLIIDGLGKTSYGFKLGAKLRIKNSLESVKEEKSGCEVSEGDTFTNKVGMMEKVVVQIAKTLFRILDGLGLSRFVKTDPRDERSNPGLKVGHKFCACEKSEV